MAKLKAKEVNLLRHNADLSLLKSDKKKNPQPAGYLVVKSNKYKISAKEEKIILGGFIILFNFDNAAQVVLYFALQFWCAFGMVTVAVSTNISVLCT